MQTTTTTTTTYSDKQGRRDRAPFALLIGPGDRAQFFAGESIPGVVAITDSTYRKDGKWSHTTYTLALAAGVQLIAGHTGWEDGLLSSGLAAAADTAGKDPASLAEALGVSPRALIQAIAAAGAERTLEAWAEAQTALEALEEEPPPPPEPEPALAGTMAAALKAAGLA